MYFVPILYYGVSLSAQIKLSKTYEHADIVSHYQTGMSSVYQSSIR